MLLIARYNYVLQSGKAIYSASYYNKQTTRKDSRGSEGAIPFDVQVKDTTKLYNVYVNVRVSSDYKYSNLFMWVNTTNPDKKTDQRRVEIKLADETGKWLGKGLGDIYDYQFPVFQRIKFPNSGFYRFELEQNMREDTLAYVKAVGVRIEEAAQ